MSTIVGLAQQVRIVQGQIVGSDTGKVYLFKTGLFTQGSQLVDSTQLTGQFFSFKQQIDEPRTYFMSINNGVGQFHFVWDRDLFITLDPDDLNRSSVEESPLNQVLKNFFDTTVTVYQQRVLNP